MRRNTILGALALAGAFAAPAASSEAQTRREPKVIGAPPAQPLASPGLYRSGNECAPDRAEAEWDAHYRFLGYACVRTSPNAR